MLQTSCQISKTIVVAYCQKYNLLDFYLGCVNSASCKVIYFSRETQ